MVETAEGIGSRKWSFVREGESASDECLVLMEGKTRLAELTKDGEAVFALLVTAPQLWAAANALILALHAAPKPLLDASPAQQSAANLLAYMVAKAVGKTDWKNVAQ
jgi:hypothetical protein